MAWFAQRFDVRPSVLARFGFPLPTIGNAGGEHDEPALCRDGSARDRGLIDYADRLRQVFRAAQRPVEIAGHRLLDRFGYREPNDIRHLLTPWRGE